MCRSKYTNSTGLKRIYWGCVLLLLLNTALMAAELDVEGLALYLPCENATNPIDASNDPTTVIVHGALGLADGQLGTQGFQFDGNAANRLEVVHADKLEGMSALTIEGWLLGRNIASHEGMSLVSKRNAYNDGDVYNLFIWENQLLNGRINGNNTNIGLSTAAIQDNTWYHVALVFDGQGPAGEMIKLYINGALESSDDHPSSAVGTGGAPVWIGELDAARGFAWDGILDEIGIWNIALTEEDVNLLMVESKMQMLRGELARGPVPADGVEDVAVTTNLSWTAGDYAVAHDVYFGTSFEDIDNADRTHPMDVLVSQGQGSTSYDLSRLDFGQTYYWRIDEVNAAPDNTIFKGNIWTFTTEPLAYAIENIMATTNTTYAEGQGPENVVNGSGLNDDDQHSTATNDMWLGTPDPNEPPYIQFAFDRVYKLHEMLVWNYNMEFEFFLGFGVKDATVEYSVDGVDWTVLRDVRLGQGLGINTYTYNSTILLEGVAAQYVRLTIASSYSSTMSHGLAEVRFTHIPVYPREPYPADGATDVALDTTLTWRPGREAVSHEVYLGPDPNALDAVGSTTEDSYNLDLDLATMYYWQVVEVNDTVEPSAWAGDVWNFTTQEFIEVDGFEAYDDDIEAGTTVWQTWIDGIDDSTNGGGIVGYAQSPFAEQTIVHSSRQSMPFFFENVAASDISEADRTFSPAQDWTINGIKSLSLWFYGAQGNTGRLYIKINGTKVIYDGDAGDIANAMWQTWNIDLSTVGNVSNVTTLTVGVEGTGSGVVYIDDIRLYGKAPELIVPAEPDPANLVGRWAFDGDLIDGSGNGHNGTMVGTGIEFENDSARGQVLSLPGGDDNYVSIGSVGISGTMSRTIACWAKADNTTIPDWTLIFGFTGTETGEGGNGSHFNIGSLGGPGGVGAHVWGWEETIFTDEEALEWHHYAMSYDGTTIRYYGDGVPMDTDLAKSNVQDLSISGDRVHVGSRITQTSSFPGKVDDAVIYSVQLTDGQIAYLAGRTAPIHQPF